MKSMSTPICDDEVHEVLIFAIDFASSFHRSQKVKPVIFVISIDILSFHGLRNM